MKSSNHKKTLFPGFIFIFLSLQENASRYRNDFDIIQCVFELCIMFTKFQIFIHIITLVKPKNKNQNFKNGEKGGVFLDFFKVTSQ